MRRILKLLSLIILISFIFLHIHRSKDGTWGYTYRQFLNIKSKDGVFRFTYTTFAQQRYDLSCSGNTQPFQPLITSNPQTGNLKANACIDPTGTVTYQGAGSSPASLTNSSGYTFYPSSDACNHFNISGTTYCAKNNNTNVLDFSGTDICTVGNNSFTAESLITNGVIRNNWRVGIYNGSIATQVGATTQWYCLGLPSTGTNQGVEIYNIGESQPPFSGIAAEQDSGTIIKETAALRTSAGVSTNTISIWFQLSKGSGQGNQVYWETMGCRLVDNIRGAEICYDANNSIGSSWISTECDAAGAWNTHTSPGGPLTSGVVGSICYNTNQSAQNLAFFRNTVAEGLYIGYNIQSEHSRLEQTTAYQNRFPYQYGVTGSSVLHASEWVHPIEFNCIASLVLGANLAKGSSILIESYDQEFTTSGSFNFTTLASESNPGFTNGRISWTRVQGGVGVINGATFFTAGSGINILSIQSGKRLSPGIINVDTTSQATTGTVKQTLRTYSIPDGPQGSDGSIFANGANPGNILRVKAWGITAANADSKTFEIDFGGTTVATITSTANAGQIFCELNIISISNTSQESIGNCDDGTIHTVTRTALTITATAAIPVLEAATTATASGDFTYKGSILEFLPGIH